MEKNMKTHDMIFPDGFLWGSAISAFQTEGGLIKNDWSKVTGPSKVKDGSSAADAVHFWKYYNEYIELMRRMNHKIFRMSVEWARIEPEEGEYDEDAIRHYRKIIQSVISAGIKPVIDIHHHSNPLWLCRKGSWLNSGVVDDFRKYTKKAIVSFGDLTDIWLTINEPVIYAAAAYMLGMFPPQAFSMRQMFKCTGNMAKAHVAAYETIHETFREKGWGVPRVGFAHHIRPTRPDNPKNPLDIIAAWLRDRIINLDFLNRINKHSKTIDIFCINYYTSDRIKFFNDMVPDDRFKKNKLGWDIDPEGFYLVLKRFWDMYHIPILLTENGVCDESDELRPGFILDHVNQMHRAIREGVKIEGYCHWSTMDNFEYTEGFNARFGLIHVDHSSPDKTRTIKPSGNMFGEIAAANGTTGDIIERFKPDWKPYGG
jgi:beta-glucosidase